MPGYISSYVSGKLTSLADVILPAPVQGSVPLYSTTLGAFGDSAREWGIAATSTTGLLLSNTTAATVGVTAQYSPSFVLGGTAYKSNATAASQAALWAIENVPATGATVITSSLYFKSSIAGGAYTNPLILTSAGAATFLNNVSGTGLYASSVIYAGATSNGVGIAPNLSTMGLGTGGGVIAIGATQQNAPLAFGHYSRPDGANNICHAFTYVPGATSVTNAATMRIASFGWTSSTGPTYTETAAVYINGAIEGTAGRFSGTAAAAGTQTFLVGPSKTEGYKTVVMTETLSPAAVETAMANAVPAGAIIRCVLANCQAALTGGGTTATWSLGITGAVNKYGTAGYPTAADSLAQNSKSSRALVDVELAAAETIKLIGAVTGGAAAGNTALTVGSVKIVVIYDAPAALANA